MVSLLNGSGFNETNSDNGSDKTSSATWEVVRTDSLFEDKVLTSVFGKNGKDLVFFKVVYPIFEDKNMVINSWIVVQPEKEKDFLKDLPNFQLDEKEVKLIQLQSKWSPLLRVGKKWEYPSFQIQENENMVPRLRKPKYQDINNNIYDRQQIHVEKDKESNFFLKGGRDVNLQNYPMGNLPNNNAKFEIGVIFSF